MKRNDLLVPGRYGPKGKGNRAELGESVYKLILLGHTTASACTALQVSYHRGMNAFYDHLESLKNENKRRKKSARHRAV